MKEIYFAGKAYFISEFSGPYFALLKLTEEDFKKLESMLKLKEFGEANHLEHCGITSMHVGDLTIFEDFPEKIDDFDSTLLITKSEYESMFEECSGYDNEGVVRTEWGDYAKTLVYKGEDVFYFFTHAKWDGLLIEVGPISIGELREKFKN